MSDFVPTTEQVRQAYEVAHEEVGASYEPDEFDLWLASVERAAAEKAWYEGYWQGINGHTGPGNPYRDKDDIVKREAAE